MSLTDKKVQAAKPKEKAYKIYDEKGLFLFIAPTGIRSWRYKFMVNGKYKEITLGQYPILSLLEARNKRNEAIKQRLDGIDPAENKQIKKREAVKKDLENSITLAKVVEDWLRIKKNEWKKSTLKDNINRISLHILPNLGHIPINNITFDMVKEIPLKLEQCEKYDCAKKIAQLIGQICMYAKLNRWTQYNIAEGLTKVLAGIPKAKKVGLPAITDPAGISLMLQNIANYIEYKKILYTPMGSALRLVPYLGLRPSELLSAQWHEINFDTAIYSIPAERMKAKKPHVVPLPKQALEIFKDMYNRRFLNTFVFPSTRNQEKHLSSDGLNKAMHCAGVPKGMMVAHGWRKVFSTLCNEALAPRELVEKCLAHSIGNEVEQAYNRAAYIEPRRILMQWYADTLDTLRNGTPMPKLELDRASMFA